MHQLQAFINEVQGHTAGPTLADRRTSQPAPIGHAGLLLLGALILYVGCVRFIS